MSKRMGLPVTLKMRHDAHYVESLTSYSGAAIGRMVPVDQIRPNPDQPRKAIGDLRELTDSIREKGVLEPLLVRFVPREDCYYIISGERRYHAARAAGLREVPCIVLASRSGHFSASRSFPLIAMVRLARATYFL